MTFTLNGKANSDFNGPPSVTHLLESLGLAGGGPVLVELDGIALRPREFAEKQISDGAKVEIIRVAAGG
jgi:thiamine biosynthesis protein ThiS